jgi:cytochrome c553
MKKPIVAAVTITFGMVMIASAADGKALYDSKCKKCHGEDGKGQTVMGKKSGCKDYTDAKVQEAVKDEDALKAIKEGFKNKEGKEVMKPTEGITDEEAKAIMAYMRSFKK